MMQMRMTWGSCSHVCYFCCWKGKAVGSEDGEAKDIGECGVLPVGGLTSRLMILGVNSGARKGLDTTSS